jgi:hypothetical protein
MPPAATRLRQIAHIIQIRSLAFLLPGLGSATRSLMRRSFMSGGTFFATRPANEAGPRRLGNHKPFDAKPAEDHAARPVRIIARKKSLALCIRCITCILCMVSVHVLCIAAKCGTAPRRTREPANFGQRNRDRIIRTKVHQAPRSGRNVDWPMR